MKHTHAHTHGYMYTISIFQNLCLHSLKRYFWTTKWDKYNFCCVWSRTHWRSIATGRGSTSLSFQRRKFSHSHIRSEMDRRRRNSYEVPASIFRFNSSRFLDLWSFKEQGVHHKTANTGGTERKDWTYHQLFSISSNPDCILLCSTSLFGVNCRNSWTFWTCLEKNGILSHFIAEK